MEELSKKEINHINNSLKFLGFECPLCKGKATSIKSSFNEHLNCECKNCKIMIMK